jgi:hypothetical protein
VWLPLATAIAPGRTQRSDLVFDGEQRPDTLILHIIHLVTPWLRDRLATPLVRNGKILARRFAPFNFSVVPSFPNVVPTPDGWVDYFPIFKEHKEDNPAQHLREFHELMHQWEIHHEDVLMNMFMFSLDEDAREWYRSLPPASISSLEQFHAAFNKHCQRYYSSELICYSCCEGYKGCVPDMVVSYRSCENESCEEEGCEEEEDALAELVEQVKALSAELEKLKAERACCSFEGSTEDFPVLEADVLGIPTDDSSVEYFIVVEALVSAPDEPVVSYLKEEAIVEEDCSLFLHEISHDVFTFGIEKKDREIVPFFQDGGVLCSPSFDDYSDEEKQSPTSHFDSMGSS